MKKLLGVTLLTGALAVLVIGTQESLAQKKGKEATSGGGTVELIESKDGKFRFTVRDSEGKYLSGSPIGHATEKEAKEVVEQLKKALAGASYVSKKSDAKKTEGTKTPAKTPTKTKKDAEKDKTKD